MSAGRARLRKEIERRRTFAIISHPDAGKTTLTEKLLLEGGAIQLAGTVKARRSGRHVTSDWMDIERDRGISTTTSVLSFPYRGHHLNLLDTPGHQDFSEDTYRTLTAVDSALMLIDHAKGVEPQTEKLFKVCRQRGIPIFVFFNKLDRHGRDPFDLMDEVERMLGMRTTVMTWPVGDGSLFRGVYDRHGSVFHVHDATGRETEPRSIPVSSPDDAALAEELGEEAHAKLREDLEMLDGAGETLDAERVLTGELAPAYFGSALRTFGVDLLLDGLIDLAPAPAGAETLAGGRREADDERFSGFVFKIQASINPAHRDRIAFVRVVTGRYEPGLNVSVQPRGSKVRLAEPRQFMARQRVAVPEAFPGDVVGLFDPGTFRIGDTLTEDPTVAYPAIPTFSPEHFALARVPDSSRRKAFQKGLDQLAEEGAIQVFRDPERGDRDPVVGAVGQLQFEVLAHRMLAEYGVTVRLQPASYVAARWVVGEDLDPKTLSGALGWSLAYDREDRPVVLVKNAHWLSELPQKFPDLTFTETRFG